MNRCAYRGCPFLLRPPATVCPDHIDDIDTRAPTLGEYLTTEPY